MASMFVENLIELSNERDRIKISSRFIHFQILYLNIKYAVHDFIRQNIKFQ